MNLIILSAELTADPLSRGYSGMSDAEAADSLNAVNRTVIKASMSGDEVFAATVGTEFGGLTDAKRNQWLAFCGRDSINPQGAANVAFLQYIFGAGSDTAAALVAARQVSVSRATELGLPFVWPIDVEDARG